ncbi:transcription factor C6 [Fusarium pseudocircinatum]|uniref:Transcription factor C6 n=1 Tax=Fusarium pseudocircinatum TaxID=56676 RepID=A0A8H5UZU2_9HYPO|nr:transcription factor C6 [Fusarium pseudocircinatum]
MGCREHSAAIGQRLSRGLQLVSSLPEERNLDCNRSANKSLDLQLAPSVAQSWDTALTQFFFDQILMPVGWYSHLPQLHYQAPPDSCLRVTISAASLFVAANQFHDAGMLQKARRTYGAALQAINGSIAHPDKCLEDETLACVLLLHVLDHLTGHSSFPNMSHLNACAQLVRMREAKGFRTGRTHDLAHSVVIQAQPWLMQGLPVDGDTLEDEAIHKWLWILTSQTPAARMAALSLEVGRLRNRATRLLAHGMHGISSLINSLDHLIGDIVRLEERLEDWQAHCEPRWVQTKTTLRTPNGEEMQASYYSDIQVSKVWNYWRVSRITLHNMMISLVDHGQSHKISIPGRNLDALKANSAQIINSMVSEIVASVPFHLQQIDTRGRPSTQRSQRVLGGFALIWPLQMLLSCEWSLTCHKIVAMETLHVISNVFGVSQARLF